MTNAHDNERGQTVNHGGRDDSDNDRAAFGAQWVRVTVHDRADRPAPPGIAALFERSSFGTEGARDVCGSVTPAVGERLARRARYLDGIDLRGHARYLASLQITEQTITGPHTPEFAFRTPGCDDAREWQLSWLPGRRFTRSQALHGMVLDTILGDLELVEDPEALDVAAGAAADLGLTVAEALVAIAERSLHGNGKLTHRELADCRRGPGLER